MSTCVEIIPLSVCSRYGLAIGASMAPFVCVVSLYFLLGHRHEALFHRAELNRLINLHGNEITFSSVLSREFHPYKPDPSPLLHICILWEVQPNEVKMIRDSLKDDVQAFLLNFGVYYATRVALGLAFEWSNLYASSEYKLA
ncbi:hypothetical protein JHK87_000615 [Glycine soja]|nr:hypothetical protein JHK87_000615 [Glycine soja]